MATLYITEFAQPGLAFGYPSSVAAEPNLAQQTVAIGAAAASAAFNPNTGLVRLHSDAICSIDFGTNPVATVTTAKRRLAANQTEYFNVPSGQSYKVGVISNT